MTKAKRQMHIGVLAVGAGNYIAGWRFPDAGTSSEDFPLLLQIAQRAERGNALELKGHSCPDSEKQRKYATIFHSLAFLRTG